MKPRLTSSTKWTSLPSEHIEQIIQVFAERFSDSLKEEQIKAEGRIYPKEFLLRISYLPPFSLKSSQLKQDNFETSIEYDGAKDNMLQLIYKSVDCIGSMVQEYFSPSSSKLLPPSWQPISFEGTEIFVQYSTINAELEALANQILGNTDCQELIKFENEDESEEEKLARIKAQLGLLEEEDEQS